ncbi:hypothetical protein [Mesorhizobium loti]|uniref:Uncharacterized protein n=1 Tax=Rhizobium loti TaxID=381 RepID=A0A6M7U7J0_RHILI|nr:hypothetical protein [Mesorhizobium loti]OBQ72404.1 hypothetical protein A8145_06230 [Mesorhizobium loti]QKC71993.1 hypothetical protein EB815_24730 [Mesorhizobium loti]
MTSIYNTGTVTVTNGSAAVVGTGTGWAVSLVTGGTLNIEAPGNPMPIAAVTDNTHLSGAVKWTGASGTYSYAIVREDSDAANVVDLYDKLTRVLVTLSLAGIHPNNSGSLAKRNALTLTADDDNYLFLRAELGVEFAFYRWDGPTLAWIGPFPVADAAAGGPVSSLVAGAGINIDSINPAVPVVKLANMANATIKGRTTAGTGAPEDLTIAQLKALLLSTTVIRDVLTANRTYYVRTDGNDANTGLVNSAGGAFLTVQKAINVVAALDISIYNVTIQVADGTYTGTVIVNGAWIGSGTVTINGNAATPANVLMQTTTSQNGVIQCLSGGRITVQNFKVTASGPIGLGLYAATGGVITHSNMDFGQVTNYQMSASGGGSSILSSGPTMTISGGGQFHATVGAGGYIRCTVTTVTLIGAPAFSASFAQSGRGGGLIEYYSNTFVGSATGKRYAVGALGTIFSNGGGVSYYPGSIAGTTDALGVYS